MTARRARPLWCHLDGTSRPGDVPFPAEGADSLEDAVTLVARYILDCGAARQGSVEIIVWPARDSRPVSQPPRVAIDGCDPAVGLSHGQRQQLKMAISQGGPIQVDVAIRPAGAPA